MTKTEQKLKIAVLVKRFSLTGGSEKYALEVVRRLVARGHEVDVYARDTVDREKLAGLGFVAVPAGRLGYFCVLDLYSFARETHRLLADKLYDVIHSHERGHMPRDISTLHSFSYRGAGYIEYPFYKKLLQVYLSPRSWLHLWLEKMQMTAPYLVAVSDVIRADLAKYYNRVDNVSVITPGVDTEWFDPDWIAGKRPELRAEEFITEKELAILFVGSEFRRKGLDRLIPAIGPGMRLIVVGRGERMRHYRDLVDRHGLVGRVEFKGLSDDVRRYYAMADVVVLPSRSEAFGMTILEGMACGLPVIVSANSGAAALIRDGDNGFIWHQQTDLAGILARLKDKDLRLRIGRHARETAMNFTWDKVTDKYEALYYQVAIEKRNENNPDCNHL